VWGPRPHETLGGEKKQIDPNRHGLLTIPFKPQSVFFHRGWKRYAALCVIAFFPTLVFLGWVLFSLPKIGVPIDFKKNAWVAMGMIMVAAYNCLWLAPVLMGALLGYGGRWVEKRQVKRLQ
jgi:hypothetical protein